jgi:hypothetical protein
MASLIAAFASVILVAAVSVLLIVGLWKLHERTAPLSIPARDQHYTETVDRLLKAQIPQDKHRCRIAAHSSDA